MTARLAPSAPLRHVMVLVVVGAVLGIAGAVAAAGITPVWYSIAVVVLTPVAAWIGGRLGSSRSTVDLTIPQQCEQRPASTGT